MLGSKISGPCVCCHDRFQIRIVYGCMGYTRLFDNSFDGQECDFSSQKARDRYLVSGVEHRCERTARFAAVKCQS